MNGAPAVTIARFRSFSPARLKAAREARGLTLLTVATRVGISLRYYQRLEAGDRGPAMETLAAIADTLSVTIDSLYAMPEEGAAP
jgi:transcriptional regulator with XRE-family HTH domain